MADPIPPPFSFCQFGSELCKLVIQNAVDQQLSILQRELCTDAFLQVLSEDAMDSVKKVHWR